MRHIASLSAALLLLIAPPGSAQTFSSGSTGADGALNLSAASCPDTSWLQQPTCYVQLPPDGVLNFTTVAVPAGVTLAFKPNLNNTPVYLLAQGAVNVEGAIDVGAGGVINPFYGGFRSRLPGPGGYAGGPGSGAGITPGFGPGAGPQPDGSSAGKWVGPLSLTPLIGGSGGAGGYCDFTGPASGGGGGGAITIASSTSISVSGSIWALGSAQLCSTSGSAGGGSSGAVRLVSNSLAVSGTIRAAVIRLEAPFAARSFTGSAESPAVLSEINPTTVSAAPAALSITSVGGYAVPQYAGQRFDTVDLLLPAQLPDPISVTVAASNIPVGTPVQITFGTGNSGVVSVATLTGTLESSSATLQVFGLNRSQLAYLFVSTTVGVPQSAALLNPSGPDRVERVRITAEPGGAPKLAFLRGDGSAVDRASLPTAFVSHFQQ